MEGSLLEEQFGEVSPTYASKSSPGSTSPKETRSQRGFKSDPPAWLDLVVSWLETSPAPQG